MSLSRLISTRKPAWDQLEKLVALLYRRGARGAAPEQVNQMVHLYRQVSADLAQLRTMQADPALIRRVNRLVTRAHAIIYRNSRPGRQTNVWRFLLFDHPRLFRATWRFTVASLIIAGSFYAMAYITVQQRPDIVADLMGGAMADREFHGDKDAQAMIERFRQVDAPVLSSFVTTNNIKVALMAGALGITYGVGTVYVLIVNGVMLGGFAGAFARSGIEPVFWFTVLPHGALELSAIAVAGGAGLIMGYGLWAPGRRTRLQALREEAVRAVLLVVGLIPAFIVAGFMEGFVTPAHVIPMEIKVGLGLLLALAFWGHLLLSGRTASPSP